MGVPTSARLSFGRPAESRCEAGTATREGNGAGPANHKAVLSGRLHRVINKELNDRLANQL